MEELTAQVEKLNMANRMNRILAVVGAVFCGAAALLFARGQALFAATLVAACLFVFFMAHQTNLPVTGAERMFLNPCLIFSMIVKKPTVYSARGMTRYVI